MPMLFAGIAVAAEPVLTVAVGGDYSSGKYGDVARTETWSVPVFVKYEIGSLVYRLSVPYVRTTGPSNVLGAGPNRVVLPSTAGPARTEEGLGDVVAGATYAAFESPDLKTGVDLTGKVKFGTGDKDKGLGTGENDYAMQVDIFHSYGVLTGLAALGRKKMGDPAGVNFRDPWYSYVGAAYRFSARTSMGVMYDWRQKLTAASSPVREVTAFITHKLDGGMKVQGYVVAGFSNASPDFGLGATLGYGF